MGLAALVPGYRRLPPSWQRGRTLLLQPKQRSSAAAAEPPAPNHSNIPPASGHKPPPLLRLVKVTCGKRLSLADSLATGSQPRDGPWSSQGPVGALTLPRRAESPPSAEREETCKVAAPDQADPVILKLEATPAHVKPSRKQNLGGGPKQMVA